MPVNRKEQKFRETVWEYYGEHGRSHLPWRKTKDPYKILVSEVMLQQTQVDRVLPKYQAFLKAFPTVRALAHAPLGEVLRVWQGLGYNRRAKMLHACAQEVLEKYDGKLPKTSDVLGSLPGIGPYTAAAVMAFAYNVPVPLIETNIRTVFLHHFFTDAIDVSDRELMPLIERTLDHDRPREWYWALMDYGAHLKKIHGNQNNRSAHYVRQSKFEGSDRQIRGAILRTLAASAQPQTRRELLLALRRFEDIRVDAQLMKLCSEGLIAHAARKYSLPT